MASFKGYAEAESENLQKVLAKLPPGGTLSRLSDLELAGVAAFIHNFYNGIKNILKQAVREKGSKLPQGNTWHRDLVELALTQGIISKKTSEALKGYLAFRHFFSHAYAIELDPARIAPLVEDANSVFKSLQHDIEKMSA